MNQKQIISAAFLGVLLSWTLAGCSAGTDRQPAQSNPSSGVQDTASPSKGEPDGALPGVTAENFPRIDGSTANLPLMAEVYSRVCGVSLSDAQAIVHASGGTGKVWRNLLDGGADLLLVYEAPENIKKELEDSGLELEAAPIGRDGLVFLVNKKNPVDSLTQKQLQDIYTGEITDWKEAGGTPGPISAFQRNAESGSQTLFLKLLMKDIEPMQPPTELVPGMMGQLIDAVATYDGSGGAIGYSVYYYAEQMYQNPDLKLLAVDGVEPSAQSIADGSYPLINDFYVVIREEEPTDSPARLLRDWLLSWQGREALEAAGYVPAF